MVLKLLPSIFLILIITTNYVNCVYYGDTYDSIFTPNEKRLHETFNPHFLYPDHCCQLVWVPSGVSDKFVSYYLKAGTFMDRDYGYAITPVINNRGERRAGIKSDQANEPGINLEHGSNLGEKYQVLTNPYNCAIGWYQTRFYKEEVPTDNKEWHFPRLSKASLYESARRYGQRMPRLSIYGDYVRYNNTIPGLLLEHYGVSIPSQENFLTEDDKKKQNELMLPETYELMYVDCKKSILSMSKAILYNITYANDDLEKLKTNRQTVEYTKKLMINNSPEPTDSEIKFKIETSDKVSKTLTKSHSDCFAENTETYHEWNANLKVKSDVNILNLVEGGIEVKGGYGGRFTKGENTGKEDGKGKDIMNEEMKRKTFEFSQKVRVPPYSKTTLIAFSNPIRGKVPFTAIYELHPTGDIVTLEESIKHYLKDTRMVRTSRDTLLVSYPGIMNVDAGHVIDIDIQTVPLNDDGSDESDE